MLGLFKTNQLSNSIMFLFYAIILRSATYVFPELRLPAIDDGGIFNAWVLGVFGESWWALEIFTVLLLSVQAFLVAYMIYEFRLDKEVSLFSGVFYILLNCCLQWFLPLSGVIVANTFLIFALYSILLTYRVPSCSGTIFNIGFWIGVSTFFEISNFVFLVFAVFGLNLMRALKLREILTVLVGFLVPYLLAAVFFFWNDQYVFFVKNHIHKYLDLSLLSLFSNVWVNGTVVFFGLLIAFHILSSGEYNKKKSIQAQKRISVFYVFMLASFFTIFFQAQTDVTNLLVLTIPLSIFMGFAFINLSKNMSTTLHWVLLFLVLAMQFRPVIFG